MKKSTAIHDIKTLQMIDSRGIPTAAVTIELADGSIGHASVPSGASTGQYEAHEKRDNGKRYNGKSIENALSFFQDEIVPAIIENSPNTVYLTDTMLRNIDGTPNKNRLGANIILATSLAYANACAKSASLPLFYYLGGINAHLLPIPMMNILNGGAHADNNLDIQEFMIMPVKAPSFKEALRMGCECYQSLKKLLSQKSLSTAVGDEGGFAPNLKNHEEALSLICDAIEDAGYKPGHDIVLALDIAASEWKEGGIYRLPKQDRIMTKDELSQYYEKLCIDFPIVSLEDPFADDYFEAFSSFRQKHPDLQIVGDDLFVTNPERIRRGITMSAANAVLIKPNQIGTLSETLDAIAIAQEGGYNTIISHRSGDTPDTFIADLAVAVNAGQIKTGAPCRGERIAKYNRLLEIEALLNERAVYGKYN